MGMKARKEQGHWPQGTPVRVGGWETKDKGQKQQGQGGDSPWAVSHSAPGPAGCAGSPPSLTLLGTLTHVLTLTRGTHMLTHLHACHLHTHVHSHLHAHTCSHIHSHLHTYTHTQSHMLT